MRAWATCLSSRSASTCVRTECRWRRGTSVQTIHAGYLSYRLRRSSPITSSFGERAASATFWHTTIRPSASRHHATELSRRQSNTRGSRGSSGRRDMGRVPDGSASTPGMAVSRRTRSPSGDMRSSRSRTPSSSSTGCSGGASTTASRRPIRPPLGLAGRRG